MESEYKDIVVTLPDKLPNYIPIQKKRVLSTKTDTDLNVIKALNRQHEKDELEQLLDESRARVKNLPTSKKIA
jgi:hypothetical protein